MTHHKVETCWRVVGDSGHDYRCGIYRDTEVLNVRVTVGPSGNQHCVYSELVEDVARAREVAHGWLRKVLESEVGWQRS